MSEKKFRPKASAPLRTIRSLTSDIDGPVRILGLVIESMPGSAIIQDLYDDIEKAATIRVLVEGELVPEHKYILIGEITEKKDSNGVTLILNANIAHDVNNLDVRRFKNTLDLERQVHSYLIR
ncbi:MAG: hypothetical protein K9W43_07795 [Candidatus Thorarchaeota archaeon]|nr:hypothetical protein [Candidatus Thorarchaeota archaeon]